MKKLLSLAVCLLLCITPALAAEAPEASAQPQAETPAADSAAPLFPAVNTFVPFPDLPAGHWAETVIRVCVETGLMEGTGHGTGRRFSPDVTLNNAQVVMMAARIHAAIHGNTFDQRTNPWYQGAVDYLAAQGIVTGYPFAYTTRQGFFDLLSHVVPESHLTPINNIKALPDTSDPMVLRFYNAGILTGTDIFGTFDGAKPLTRAEGAAMVARIAQPALRRTFVPAGQVPAGPFAESEPVMTVNGTAVTYGEFLELLLTLTGEVMELYDQYGLVFEWDHNYLVESWCNTLREGTKSALTARACFQQEMTRLNLTEETELAPALFGQPTEAELAAKAAEEGADRTRPGTDEMLTEMLWEDKLDEHLSALSEQAEVVTTPVYGQIDPHELWAIYNP